VYGSTPELPQEAHIENVQQTGAYAKPDSSSLNETLPYNQLQLYLILNFRRVRCFFECRFGMDVFLIALRNGEM
jgi:hypothetical protein